MEKDWIYLETYLLQQDMRIRLPKSILVNMPVEKGKTEFDIYYEKGKNVLILKPVIEGDNHE
ncbi:sucrose-6-phosphate hydrolase [Ileibacterium valens]|uniref:sucrose-6-phosphate hydrolase n=1 Tax=Ileibacterium valens TaxID=1862668 RepID=UPI002354BBB9|nr:sucrose-6-phosphate hydrolase [Ileibacterium valens]